MISDSNVIAFPFIKMLHIFVHNACNILSLTKPAVFIVQEELFSVGGTILVYERLLSTRADHLRKWFEITEGAFFYMA